MLPPRNGLSKAVKAVVFFVFSDRLLYVTVRPRQNSAPETRAEPG